MAPKKAPKAEDSTGDLELLPTPTLDSQSLRMSYRIARGEQGVLTFEPYKSILLPMWRFKTVAIAEKSSKELKTAFDGYVKRDDFVGADMARKFIQMGMTRAKRYANHKGGKKYDRSARVVEKDGGKSVELPKSDAHDGRDEKLQASEIFKAAWKQCTSDGRYIELKNEFLAEQKIWDKEHKAMKVKTEVKQEVAD